MYSLQLRCPVADAETVAAELLDPEGAWQALALSETEEGESVTLLAGFAADRNRDRLLRHFAQLQPQWQRDDTDWIAETKRQWPMRMAGERIVLAAPWDLNPSPEGRVRIVLNPGMASGTGEHPCTQLALEALEKIVTAGSDVADMGAGSGILAIAAAQLGAASVLAVEPDTRAIGTAKENIAFNRRKPLLIAGFPNAVRGAWADITVANISGTVLLAILGRLAARDKANRRPDPERFRSNRGVPFRRSVSRGIHYDAGRLVLPMYAPSIESHPPKEIGSSSRYRFVTQWFDTVTSMFAAASGIAQNRNRSVLTYVSPG